MMVWKQHGSFGGKSAVSSDGKEFFVIPNAETGKWEVWTGGHPLPGSWHTQGIAIGIAEQEAGLR